VMVAHNKNAETNRVKILMLRNASIVFPTNSQLAGQAGLGYSLYLKRYPLL
jgi:hypothetical protein